MIQTLKEVADQTNAFAADADADLRKAARVAAGHIVVAAIHEGLALGSYVIPNCIDKGVEAPAWIARICWNHDDRLMPEVGIAGMVAAMLCEKRGLTVRDVADAVFVLSTPRTLTNVLLKYELNLIGDDEGLYRIFDPDGPVEDALFILREYEDFLEWVVDQLATWYELTPLELNQYAKDNLGIVLIDEDSGSVPYVE
jgi:hypothetical protein